MAAVGGRIAGSLGCGQDVCRGQVLPQLVGDKFGGALPAGATPRRGADGPNEVDWTSGTNRAQSRHTASFIPTGSIDNSLRVHRLRH
jgi:hypothetical protein